MQHGGRTASSKPLTRHGATMRSLINQRPGTSEHSLLLGLLPFVLLLMRLSDRARRCALGREPARQAAAGARRASVTAVERYAFEPRRRAPASTCCGSTPRPACGASVIGVAHQRRARPGVRRGRSARCRWSAPAVAVLAALSMIPPLAILPILFIVFGLGELSKVMLIVIGIAPVHRARCAAARREMPRELLDQGADARRARPGS